MRAPAILSLIFVLSGGAAKAQEQLVLHCTVKDLMPGIPEKQRTVIIDLANTQYRIVYEDGQESRWFTQSDGVRIESNRLVHDDEPTFFELDFSTGEGSEAMPAAHYTCAR